MLERICISSSPHLLISSSDFISVPIRRTDDRSDFGGIFGFQVLGVPFDLLAFRPDGQVAQQNGFGKRPGVVGEVGCGLLPALDSADPLLEVTGRLRGLYLSHIRSAYD